MCFIQSVRLRYFSLARKYFNLELLLIIFKLNFPGMKIRNKLRLNITNLRLRLIFCVFVVWRLYCQDYKTKNNVWIKTLWQYFRWNSRLSSRQFASRCGNLGMQKHKTEYIKTRRSDRARNISSVISGFISLYIEHGFWEIFGICLILLELLPASCISV